MLWDWFDNPIFVKHVRSRLRPQPFASSVVIVVLLCFCILYGSYQTSSLQSGGCLSALLVLQIIILGIMGMAQTGASVNGAKTSGVLDFHRVSPLSPTELTLGFFFGAPIREYLLTAVTLPFSFLCLAFGYPDFRSLVQMLILLVFTSWVLHALGLLSALIFKTRAGGGLMLGLFIYLGMLGSGSLFAGFNLAGRLSDEDRHLDFFTVPLPWLAFVLLYIAFFLFFIFLAVRRKMESERFHALSKPQALAAMTTLAVLALGGVWNLSEYNVLALLILYALVIAGVVLTAVVTPSQAEYVKGLWRAQKEKRDNLSVWHDLSLNRVFLWVVCTITLATCTLTWNGMEDVPMSRGTPLRNAFPLAIANGVLVVAYFGLALQYFNLRFGRRATNYFGLFLFMIWVMPLIVGMISLASNTLREGPAQTIFALSPIAGIAITAGMTDVQGGYGPEGAAITPSLFYAFLFNMLLTTAKRRVRKNSLFSNEKPQASPIQEAELASTVP